MKPRNFVRMFKPQFAALVEIGSKTQTVRPWPRRLPREGDTISLRTWTGKPYRSKQRILATATISRIAVLHLRPEGQVSVDAIILDGTEREAFAKADGFPTYAALFQWFKEQHALPFTGIVIHWTFSE